MEETGLNIFFFFVVLTIVKIKRYKWIISNVQSYIRLNRTRRKTIFLVLNSIEFVFKITYQLPESRPELCFFIRGILIVFSIARN